MSQMGRLKLPSGTHVNLRVRRTQGRRVRLCMHPDAVELALPRGHRLAPGSSAHAFLVENLPWIEAQLRRNPAIGQAAFTRHDEWEVPLAGFVVPVVWHCAAVARACIMDKDEEIHAFAPAGASDATRRGVVRQALMARLRQDVAACLARWLPTIPGGMVSRVSVAATHSQWGSMSRSRRLSLASSLVGARPSALEYVIIHELCHQLHMDHSPAFWAQVRARCPNYRAETAYLSRVGPRMQGLMSRIGA